MSGGTVPGPGALRVSRFIGRLGVASLPAIEAGLELDQRVVRRHVARLEAAGWLVRAPWVWGEGSVAWLTGAGIESTGLGGIRALKSPGTSTIAHGVMVGWSAARVERRRRVWKSARELAIDPERWAVEIRCDRGYTTQLPDLAVWLRRDAPPVAVIAETGMRREDRQKKILTGWRDAIMLGRYTAVQYDCTSESVARMINRLAEKVHLTAREFKAAEQPRAEEIATLSPASRNDEPINENPPHADGTHLRGEQLQLVAAPAQPPPRPVQQTRSEPRPAPPPDTPDAAAERERRYRQIMGLPEPKRRRWRR